MRSSPFSRSEFNNPSDPLLKVPDRSKELMTTFAQAAHGHKRDDVIVAAVNLLVNCIRQGNATATAAGGQYDEVVGRAKAFLMECYSPVGSRRNVFASRQDVIVPPDAVLKPFGRST